MTTDIFKTNPFAVKWRAKLRRLALKKKLRVCEHCGGTGIITKTEWHEDEEREFSYDVEVRCACQED